MAWGSKTQIETAAAVAGTELYSDAVDLNPGEQAHLQVVGNSNGTTDTTNAYVRKDGIDA